MSARSLARSAEPGETWSWRYVDRQRVETADVAPVDVARSATPQPQSVRPFVDALAPAVLESVARMDGAVVFDSAGRLLAFGSILRHTGAPEAELPATEGGRTTAALDASHLGRVLMVSEDGRISFMHHGHRVWQL